MHFEENFNKGKESVNRNSEVYYNPEMGRIVERASDLFIEAINKKKGEYNIALCGGRSSVELYKKISERASEVEDLSKLHIFLIDERFGTNEGDYDRGDRNTAVIEEHLLRKLVEVHNFSPENFHRLPEGENVSEVTEAYNEIFKKNVPNGKFDLVVLGSGEDGHVASIFPEKEAVNSQDEGFSYEMNSPKYPPIRITALPKTIQESYMTFLFIIGKAKEQALKDFKNNTGVAALVLGKAEKSIVFTDIEDEK
jgi:6-phosphogluconolactonase